jgi:hypothetical protein
MLIYFPESFRLRQLDIVLDRTIAIDFERFELSQRNLFISYGQAEALRSHRHSLGPAIQAAG